MPVFTFEIVRQGEAPVIADVLRLPDERAIWCGAEAWLSWTLAIQLKRAHLPIWEIEATLRHETQYGNTPKDLLSQIPSLLNSQTIPSL